MTYAKKVQSVDILGVYKCHKMECFQNGSITASNIYQHLCTPIINVKDCYFGKYRAIGMV